MSHRFVFRAAVLIALAASCAFAQEVKPFGEGFAAFQSPSGEWREVGTTFLESDDPSKLAHASGSGVFTNGRDGRTSHLITEAKFGDVEVHVEFMVPKGSNSGVYLQGRYEIQVFDSYGVKSPEHSDCGGIYQRYDEARGHGYEGHPPRINASFPPGEWQSFDITFRAPRFDANGKKKENAAFVKVVHNGQVIHENVELTGPTRAAKWFDEQRTGPLMLQGDHGPVAYRNLNITPLNE